MLEDGELPAMKAVLDSGTWRRVTSPSRYANGAVWPSFYSGLDVSEHGQCSRWNWDPAQMRMIYTDTSGLTPFWKTLDEGGATVGVIDVPFAPFVGLPKGFEVLEWGPHDRIVGRVQASPGGVADDVAGHPSHPFNDDLARPPLRPEDVPAFLDECIEGVRRRGDLAEHLLRRVETDVAVVLFTESHHAGHYLWHTVEPELEMYADLRAAPAKKTLEDLYREMDSQVGRLIEAAGPGTSVFVFAVHGMERARGVPTVLEPFLEELGMAHVDRSVDMRRSALLALKERIPRPLRDIYRRSVPLARRSQWGKAAVLPHYDWSRTRAFAMPIDHEGQIRINLAGREAQGIVPPEEYDQTCDAIERAVKALTTSDGRPAVDEVLRAPRGPDSGPLADLIVLWSPAAFESPVRTGSGDAPTFRRELTAQHSPEGFCISNAPAAGSDDEPIAAQDLHRLIAAAAGR
jgi:predicted AlkP superfamily phosphohydrolase/phosphomutase